MADVRVALIGSGRMGAFHGETLARRMPGAAAGRGGRPGARARPSGWPATSAPRGRTPTRRRCSPTRRSTRS